MSDEKKTEPIKVHIGPSIDRCMVCEELYKSDNQFMSLVKKVFDYVPYEEIGWSWVEVEYFSLV